MGVLVEVGVTVGVLVEVGVTVGVLVEVGVTVGVLLGVGVMVGVAVGVGVDVGVGAALIVIVAVTGFPPSPALLLLVAARITNEPLPLKLVLGVNFKPALAWSKVIKLLVGMAVVPSFWKSVPLLMLVILKCVTSLPSAPLRLMTSPLVVCLFSLVVALVTLGVSATGRTVSTKLSIAITPSPSVTVRVMVAEPN